MNVRPRAQLLRSVLPIVAVVVLATVTYGIFTKSLGFYWDDWPLVWNYHFHGTQGLTDYFRYDRPFLGALYSLLFPLIGLSPVGWHVLAVLLQSLSAILLFFTFHRLGPINDEHALLIAMFVLVYPGFSQQAIALTYAPANASLLLFVLSLFFTRLSLQLQGAYGRLCLAMSLLSAASGYLIGEYFVGLELVRPLIISLAMQPQASTASRVRLKNCLVKWAPYAAVFLAYLVWRLFIQRTASRPSMDAGALGTALLQSPVAQGIPRILGGLANVLMATLMAWSRTAVPALLDVTAGKSVLVSWLVGGIAAGIGILSTTTLATRAASGESGDSRGNPGWTVLLVGVTALACAGIPLMYSRLQISYDDPFLDRYSFPFAIGASLVLVSVVELWARTRFWKRFIVASVMFLGASFQFRAANEFRDDWIKQKALLWQLAWRAPNLEQGTAVLVAGLPPRSLIRGHAAGMLDLLYDQTHSPHPFDYFMFDMDWMQATTAIAGFIPNKRITGQLRSFTFFGTTAKSLVICNPPMGSLRVVSRDPAPDDFMLPAACRAAAQVSDVDVIADRAGLPEGPLLEILGPEPRHEWSYYYQRAQLARQFGRWGVVSRLKQQALRDGYRPEDPMEWLPFIEADAQNQDYDSALAGTRMVLHRQANSVAALSMLWRRILLSAHSTPDLGNVVDSLREDLMLESAQDGAATRRLDR